MGLYAGQSQWNNDVYQYDVTDPVTGGPNGIANKPLKDLADRTTWLKDQLGIINRLEGETILQASAPITNTLAGQLITLLSVPVAPAMFVINNFQLDDVASFAPGTILLFESFSNDGSVNNILTHAGQPIYDKDFNLTFLSMHNKEALTLIAFTDHWKVVYMHGNFSSVGEEVTSRKQLNNTLVMKGQIIKRAQYPRLWAWVNANLTLGQEMVSEAAWGANGLKYMGCFSNGDGVSTFRLPDERGMFSRMLDLGRGIDVSRLHPYAGGYEADQVGKHDHDVPGTASGASGGGSLVDGNGDGQGTNVKTSQTGGPETIVKNIAKLNLIKY